MTPRLFRLHFHYLIRAKHRMHVFHFVLVENDWDWAKFLTELTTQLVPRIMLHRSVEAGAIGCVYQEIFPDPLVIFPFPVIFPGNVFKACSDPSRVAVMRMRTGLRGPKNRGRKFIVGLPDDAWDGKYLKPDVHRDISNTWSSLEWLYHPDNADYPLTWGIFHRYVNGVKQLPIPFNFWPVNNLSLNVRRVRHEHTAHFRSFPFGFP